MLTMLNMTVLAPMPMRPASRRTHGGESRAAPHEPHGESKVLQRRLEHRCRHDGLDRCSSLLLDASQPDQGVSAGFLGAHPESTVVVDDASARDKRARRPVAIQTAAAQIGPSRGRGRI